MDDSKQLMREHELFSCCLGQPESAWDEILREQCPDDEVLREKVVRLLRRHAETGTDNTSFLKLDRSDPDVIGPYRILQRLGEGGMGIVYAAEQREPVRRRVAIKVLRAGHNSREVLARFDVERQALALMNHLNIARIVDAGTTADQRPYIVMEFVPGESVTTYCERNPLPLRERLALFAEICDAVQHAHQRGIIHRDLKPSNILIMEGDGGRPVPKIIDFGIAKATSQRLTDHTLETKVGSLMGTPDYMSPEQAELSPLDVDTRADVYALGAVLYQLLTGTTPLNLAGSGKSYAEMQHLIKEQVPPPPSHRLRGTAQRAVRGELDWITGKALEKQRAHRYASAADLARDIRAHLADDTVLAGPPSRLRKLHKFMRRHWLASSLLAILAIVVALSQVMLVQKNRELARERDRANAEAAASENVTAFMLDIFEAADPGNENAGRTTARELLDHARAEIDADASLLPPVRLRLLAGLGKAYSHLGLHMAAIDMLRQADALAAEHGAIEQRFYILSQLGLTLQLVHRSNEASDVLQQSLALAQTAGITGFERLFDIRRAAASLQLDTGRTTQARDQLVALLSESETAFGAGDARTLDVAARLVYVHTRLAEYDAARDLTERMLPIARSAVHDGHPVVSYLRGNLGSVYMALEEWDKAEAINRDILAQFIEQFGPDAQPTQNAILGVAIATRDREEALRMLADLEKHQREQFGNDAPQLINTLLDTGWVHLRIPGNESQAREYYERALSLAGKHGMEGGDVPAIHYGLAALDVRAGDVQSALSHFARAATTPTLQYRAAHDEDFAPLYDNKAFRALLGDFAPAQ